MVFRCLLYSNKETMITAKIAVKTNNKGSAETIGNAWLGEDDVELIREGEG